jgi:hypothetical protein
MKSISHADCLAFGCLFFNTKINVNNEIKIFKNSNSMDTLRRMNNLNEVHTLRSTLRNLTTVVLVSKHRQTTTNFDPQHM